MALKTLEEIIATKDAEAAFLFVTASHEDEKLAPPTSEQLDELHALVTPWLVEIGDDDYSAKALNKLSSDENRRIFLQSQGENGFGDLIGTFADDHAVAHIPLMLEFFIEHCDDPGYFDEMLDINADKLSDAQKLQLLERKRKLG